MEGFVSRLVQTFLFSTEKKRQLYNYFLSHRHYFLEIRRLYDFYS